MVNAETWTCGHVGGAVCAECHRLLKTQIEQLRTENWQIKQANADLLHDLTVICETKDAEIERLRAELKKWQAAEKLATGNVTFEEARRIKET